MLRTKENAMENNKERVNPKACYDLEINGVKIKAHGLTEKWSYETLLAEKAIAESVYKRNKIYESEKGGFYQAPSNDTIGDGGCCSADLKTTFSYCGKDHFAYTELDGANHRIRKMNPRDEKMAMSCAKNNQCLVKLSTNLEIFTSENKQALVNLYNFTHAYAQAGVKANVKAKALVAPTVIRATKRRGVEAGLLVDGKFEWTKIADIADFM